MLEKHSLLTQRLSDTSPGQFFLVQGPTDTVILERLATLNKRLEQAVEQGLISGASSPYDWLIDQPAQQRNAQMSVAANATALAFVERQLNVELAKQNRDVVLAQPNDFANYSPFASLWITGKDKGAVVLLSGVVPESLNALQQIGDTLEGVDFINLTADISTSLGFYRNLILWIVGFSLLIMLVILSRLYKKDSLHICLPCLLSLLLTLGMLGWFAIPISLFSALPLLLLLGLSIDYALLMHSEREHKDVWASVCHLTVLRTVEPIVDTGAQPFRHDRFDRHHAGMGVDTSATRSPVQIDPIIEKAGSGSARRTAKKAIFP